MSIEAHHGFHILPVDGSDASTPSPSSTGEDSIHKPYTEEISILKHNIYVTKIQDIPHVACVAKGSAEAGKVFKVVVWNNETQTSHDVPTSQVKNPLWRRLLGLPPHPESILGAINQSWGLVKWHPVHDDNVEHELKTLEGGGKSEDSPEFTAGLVYVAAGQGADEKQFLSNKSGSPAWDEFMALIGERVTLEGYSGFNGHLDTKNNLTGTESIVAEAHGASVMYHVSTLLPHDPTNDRQLDRKRFIGNDAIVVLLMEGTEPYSPVAIKSLQNQVYFVVHPDTREDGTPIYRLGIVCKNGVPNFNPPLPNPPEFTRNEEFRRYYYEKLVAARAAASEAPVFKQMVAMARVSILLGLANKHIPRPGQ